MAIESAVPETRPSLLIRLADTEDQSAWEEFVELYQPVIYRTARYAGLQDADALDVAQQVLMSVGRALAQRPHNPDRARFRTWLGTVTRNATINALRINHRRPTGDSHAQHHLRMLEARSPNEEIIEREYQKELFRKAARLIQPEFTPDSWQAFWLSTVEQKPIAAVAEQLSKQPGSIYAARSRIIRRLRQEIERLQDRGAN